jgi:hypothetical protein
MKLYPKNAVRLTFAAAAGALLLLSGCGRTIPTISPELLAQKKSLLVLTSASLSEAEKNEVQATVRELAASEHIALEIVGGTASITPELAATMKNTAYDGIVAVGDELLPELVNTAREDTGKRFVLLGSGLTPTPIPGELPANVMLKQLDETRKSQLWDEWVQLQKVAGLPILWVSRTTVPIPAHWAPSEEADHVLLMDLFQDEAWFNQLSFQAKTIGAQWIATYTPVDEKIMAKIRTLRISTLDMGNGLAAQYQWKTIIPASVSLALGEEWKGGFHFYQDHEVTLSRK